MYNKWLSYTLRARNSRQKYFTLLQQKVNARTTRIIANTRARIIKGIAIGTVGAVAYYFGNKMHSEHFEKKQMKKKLMKDYPQQTYIISFEQDPNQILREVSVSTSQQQPATPVQNKHCIYLTQQSPQTSQLQQKLGNTVIIFSPTSMDELCRIIERCYKYRHTAIVGDYPMPADSELQDHQLLMKELAKIKQPHQKNKYVVINLSLFKDCEIDQVNQMVEVNSGVLCREVNEELRKRGYEPLFKKFCDDISLYEVLVNNLPLESNQMLTNRIQNLSLVSAEGKRFKSSTQVENFGQIPNLTPLFLGTGGVFAVPAKVNIKLHRQQPDKQKLLYSISSNNNNDLVMRWRQVRQYLSSRRIPYKLSIPSSNKITIETQQPLNIPLQFLHQQPSHQPQQKQQQEQVRQNKVQYIFSINNKILQKLLLNNVNISSLVVQNNLLEIQAGENQESIRKLISDVSLEGGVLVWCRDKQVSQRIKERTDVLEAGAQLMKKIVQIREGVDSRQVLYSHPRYEKYFAKGLFRKMTEFIW